MIYLIRHCQAVGPPRPESPLTAAGERQAYELATSIEHLGVRRIVSSPYQRAIQTATPLAASLKLSIEEDYRLRERENSFDDQPGWEGRLREMFRKLISERRGREPGADAMARGVAAVNDVIAAGIFPVAIVTHGQLLTLILRHFDGRSGYEEWRAMTNPDVFQLSVDKDRSVIERIWQ